MTILNTEPNLPAPDDFYDELIALHRDLTDAQSALVNARLILLLANHIGDLTCCARRWPRRAKRSSPRRVIALTPNLMNGVPGDQAHHAEADRPATSAGNAPPSSPLAYQSGFGNEFATEALAGRAAGRPEFAAARAVRPLRGAVVGHRVHGAARRQPALVDVPDSARRDARAVPPDRQRAHRQPLRRGRHAARSVALGSVADADCADRFRRRAS